MSKISRGVIQYRILVLANRKERMVALQSIMRRSGFEVLPAMTLYEAQRLVQQHLPNLILTDAVYSDGDAGILFDRLQGNSYTSKIPIVVSVMKKSREELAPLAKRKFAGFILGKTEPQSLVAKIRETLESLAPVSPFFYYADDLNLKKSCSTSIAVEILGYYGSSVVVKSDVGVHANSKVVCKTLTADSDFSLEFGTNVHSKKGIYNLYPRNRLIGHGVEHLEPLREIRASIPADSSSNVIVVTQDKESIWPKILQGYKLQVKTTPSLSDLPLEDLGGKSIFVEKIAPAELAAFLQKFKESPESRKPNMVLGMDHSQVLIPGVTSLPPPIGLGPTIELLRASFVRGLELDKSIETSVSPQIAAMYEADMNLLGMDESGVILESKIAFVSGTKVSLNHKFFQYIFGDTQLQIKAVAQVSSSQWQVRVSPVETGVSKLKVWEKIAEALELEDIQISRKPADLASA